VKSIFPPKTSVSDGGSERTAEPEDPVDVDPMPAVNPRIPPKQTVAGGLPVGGVPPDRRDAVARRNRVVYVASSRPFLAVMGGAWSSRERKTLRSDFPCILDLRERSLISDPIQTFPDERRPFPGLTVSNGLKPRESGVRRDTGRRRKTGVGTATATWVTTVRTIFVNDFSTYDNSLNIGPTNFLPMNDVVRFSILHRPLKSETDRTGGKKVENTIFLPPCRYARVCPRLAGRSAAKSPGERPRC